MINSMTGYGDAEGQLNGVTYMVEIKGVNNRYFKPKIKLPEPVAFLEEQIYEMLRKNIVRGSVDYTVRLKNASADLLFFAVERDCDGLPSCPQPAMRRTVKQREIK